MIINYNLAGRFSSQAGISTINIAAFRAYGSSGPTPPATQPFQPGSKGKKTDPHLYEKFPDFEPSRTYEIEYLLLTL